LTLAGALALSLPHHPRGNVVHLRFRELSHRRNGGHLARARFSFSGLSVVYRYSRRELTDLLYSEDVREARPAQNGSGNESRLEMPVHGRARKAKGLTDGLSESSFEGMVMPAARTSSGASAQKRPFDLLAAARALPPIAPIEHVFVLMLENRSFDHLFGLSGIHGVSAPPANFGFASGASDRLSKDPPHEYENVSQQLASGAMTGFGAVGGPDAMRGFDAQHLPVLAALAENSLLMDNWFSSMPGPTWPNRFFAHAASSGGLDNSPSGLSVDQAVNSELYSYRFDAGHIFDRLLRERRTWRVYHDDAFPQVLALQGMVDKRLDRTFFRRFSEFGTDVVNQYDVTYTFIEPSYDPFRNYANGNSQHPLGSVAAGEALVKSVYESIFSGPTGASSVLLVVWDEHGGFFDHVTPPMATPPGDRPLNHERASSPADCKFDRFGVRVPALLVSPWLPSGLGSQIFKNREVFDHASIISSLRMTFGLGNPLTARDKAAPSWYKELLHEPRALPAKLPAPPVVAALTVDPIAMPTSPSLLGTFESAVRLDRALAARTGQSPLIASTYRDQLATVDTTAGQATGGMMTGDQRDAIVGYLAALSARDAKARGDAGR
jgi:phospholipase C